MAWEVLKWKFTDCLHYLLDGCRKLEFMLEMYCSVSCCITGNVKGIIKQNLSHSFFCDLNRVNAGINGNKGLQSDHKISGLNYKMFQYYI